MTFYSHIIHYHNFYTLADTVYTCLDFDLLCPFFLDFGNIIIIRTFALNE